MQLALVRLAFVFLVVTTTMSAGVTPRDSYSEKWNAYKFTFGKQYALTEDSKRFQVYVRNSMLIDAHNELYEKGNVSFEIGHNQFSDMTREEFERTVLITEPNQRAFENASIINIKNGDYSFPESVNWSNFTGIVKNQGSCGSCYAFAALGAFEAALSRKNNGKEYDLSEQEIVDCSDDYGNSGCDGGLAFRVFQYIRYQNGVEYEDDYPYRAYEGSCRRNAGARKELLTTHVVTVATEEALVSAIATVGPLAISMYASLDTFRLYKKGIYDDEACTTEETNHAVLAVGYGEEDGKKYILAKNSWKTSWGDKGYFKITRGKNMCSINKRPTYPVL